MAVERIGLRDLWGDIGREGSIVVCSASYESRCKAIPLEIGEGPEAAYICVNENLAKYFEDAIADLRSHFGSISGRVSLDSSKPLVTATALREMTDGFGDHPGFLFVDITTFTREGLLMLMRLLHMQSGLLERCRFCYTPAKDYSIGEEGGNKWLSKGVREIRSILGYPGAIRPSRRTHLVVMVGFEDRRASAVIEAYEPYRLTVGLGEGESPVSRSHHRVNLEFYKRVVSQYANVSEFSFSVEDPVKAAEHLQEAIDRGSDDCNVIVAPLNNTVSTVGAAVAAFRNEEIQLCYGRTEQYNTTSYSEAADYCLVFSLDLG